eukprot:SAG22_NODE_143_length_17909_cov_34.254969_8_plen_85_part_00
MAEPRAPGPARRGPQIIYCIHNIDCRLSSLTVTQLVLLQLVLMPTLPAASLVILGLKQPYLTPPNAGARGRRLSWTRGEAAIGG